MQETEAFEGVQLPPSVRRLSFRDVVWTYMQRRMDGSVHPAFNTQGTLTAKYESKPGELSVLRQERYTAGLEISNIRSKALTSDELEDIYSGVGSAQRQLVEVMNDFQVSVGRKKDINVDPNGSHTLDEIDEMLENASEVLVEAEHGYSIEKTKGAWGRIRRGLRSFARHANNANFFISLLPSEGNYLSVLSGGLKLVCAAATRLGTVRIAISNALEEIPALLSDKGQLLHLIDRYGVPELLHQRNAALSISILHAISAMIKWFQAKWTKSIQKFGKALLKPATAFEEEIVELLQNINKRATQFKSQADISYKEIDLQNTEQAKALMVRMVDDNEYRHSIVVRKLDSTSIEVHRSLEHLHEKQDSQAKAISGIYDMLMSDPDRAQSAFSRRPSSDFQEQDIIEAYGYDPYLLGEDCQRLLDMIRNMDVDDQERAVELMRNTALRSWLSLRESSALLVHGRGSDTSRSPISFASAKLVSSLWRETLNPASKIVTLAFFCGEHANQRKDQYASPCRMVLYLVLQLLEQQVHHKRETHPQVLDYMAKELDINRIDDLLGLFQTVLVHLPEDTMVFIVIDGISHFEDGSRRSDAMDVIRGLLALMENGNGPTVKLLATSPALTRSTWKVFEGFKSSSTRTEVLTLRHSYSGRVGFKALGWNLDVGESIASLQDDKNIFAMGSSVQEWI